MSDTAQSQRADVAPVSRVLYLHGFNSASASPKARLVASACDTLARESGRPLHCLTPDLPDRPQAALDLAERLLDECLAAAGPSSTLLVGSSMGGFLATCLAERHDLRAVLINPAVRPARFVADYLGLSLVNAYTGQAFTVGQSHFDELTALDWRELIDPSRYLVMLGSDDETLDCRDALRAYAGARVMIEPGEGHGFDCLPRYLPALFGHGGWDAHSLTPAG